MKTRHCPPIVRSLAAALAVSTVMVALVPHTAHAQGGAAPLAAAQFDPSDAYFQGYLTVREAEELEGSGNAAGALEKYRRANELFAAIRRYYPEWKPEMVAGRAEKTLEATARVSPAAQRQNDDSRNAVAELEGTPIRDAAPGEADATPGILTTDPNLTRKLEEARAEVERLRKLVGDPAARARDASRAQDISRQNDFLRAQLRAAEANVESLRSQLAASPIKEEMKALNQRIDRLEQERQAMGMALSQSRSEHTESLAKIDTLKADLDVMRQKYADLRRDLEGERDISRQVVAGQRRQMQELEDKLKEKDRQLTAADQRIAALTNELQQSHAAYAQLRDERDGLLQERDQMQALLKLNEGGRIQQLIDQNMALAKNLREANERLDRLNRDNNATKDDYTDALRDLAIAKTQIHHLQRERQTQDLRIKELSARLQREGNALSSGTTDASPAEMTLLRDIIQRQLRTQEHRRQARELLIEAAKEIGAKDERVAKAVELLDGQEITLSPEEMKLVADRQVDGEFISPFARDRGTVDAATSALNRDITVFERTAEKAYVSGRYLPARELLQMVLDQHPGHIPSLCKLGIVHMKLNEQATAVDSFRRATELDENNAYARRMLGFSLMAMGDIPNAERELRRAVQLSPTDAKSFMLLARACYNLGRKGEAESFFKAAINADPLPSEPYYNLAILCQRDKRLEDARNYYHQALERGAKPDPALEDKLRAR